MAAFSSKTYLAMFLLTVPPYLVYQPWILWWFLYFVAGLSVFAALMWCTFQTLNMLNGLNIQWAASKKESEISEALKKQHEEFRKSTYPQEFASGWYPLCWSHEVKRGEVIQRNALGKSYAIFRGDVNGEIGVLDAFCPHMGCNLVVGGTVSGDRLQCPFHLWKFDRRGACTSIPYLKSKKIPQSANATAYPSTEYHDMICVYFGDGLPAYHLPVLEHLLDATRYRLVSSLDYGSINMHLQEFAENAADWMHFSPIHGKMMVPFTRWQIPFVDRWLSIHHRPATHIGGGSGRDSVAIKANDYGPDQRHFLYFVNKAQLRWNGQPVPNSDGNACITFCGPAGVCIFRFSIPAIDPSAEIVLFHTHLPLDAMNLRVRFHWYASRRLPALLVWYVVGNWIAQWTNDLDIWENKILLRKPCLVRGDGPIFKVRRWWRQFYPEPTHQKLSDAERAQSGHKKIVVQHEHEEEEEETTTTAERSVEDKVLQSVAEALPKEKEQDGGHSVAW